jgi:transposase InsO family protein
MSQAISPSAQRSYGLDRVCRVWKIARSSVYARRCSKPRTPRRRGPRAGVLSDAELLACLRSVLSRSPWVGEGYRKAWARLRHEGVRTSGRRVLRLMRENQLQVPVTRHERGPQAHDRTIVTQRPDEMWGTDATGAMTRQGMATIFFVIDHCTAECLGIHAARRGTRFEALEPLRQAVRTTRGRFDANAADGTRLRHDHGSQFISHAYQEEIRFLGIESSPAFVREPEGNGCAERFVRTLKEQVLWLRRFDTVEDLLAALHEFKERYNKEWIIQRHGYLAPSERRAAFAA